MYFTVNGKSVVACSSSYCSNKNIPHALFENYKDHLNKDFTSADHPVVAYYKWLWYLLSDINSLFGCKAYEHARHLFLRLSSITKQLSFPLTRSHPQHFTPNYTTALLILAKHLPFDGDIVEYGVSDLLFEKYLAHDPSCLAYTRLLKDSIVTYDDFISWKEECCELLFFTFPRFAYGYNSSLIKQWSMAFLDFEPSHRFGYDLRFTYHLLLLELSQLSECEHDHAEFTRLNRTSIVRGVDLDDYRAYLQRCLEYIYESALRSFNDLRSFSHMVKLAPALQLVQQFNQEIIDTHASATSPS